MCEITVVDPDRTSEEAIHQLAAQLFKEQGDGFGILAVHVDEKFTYDAYRKTEPDWMQLHDFLQRNEGAWRYVLHGRAKTAGGVNRQNTHPLPVDCPQCENVQWVVHNGSVRSHQQNRASLINVGHEFETTVDSEVIAHKVGELPEDLDDIDDDSFNIRGNLNYFVFTDEGIFVRLSSKYHVTDDFIVSCAARRRESDAVPAKHSEMSNDNKWFLVKPCADEDYNVTIESKERPAQESYYNNRTGRSTGTMASTAGSASPDSSGKVDDIWTKRTRYNATQNTVTEVREDLVPGIDEIVAYEVAPGVVKVIDLEREDDGAVQFIREDEYKKAYDWYTGELNESAAESDEADDSEEVAGEALEQLFDFDDPDENEITDEINEAAVQDAIEASGPLENGYLETMTKTPDQMKPPEVALMELTAVFGDSKRAEEELKQLTPQQIEEIARTANHVTVN